MPTVTTTEDANRILNIIYIINSPLNTPAKVLGKSLVLFLRATPTDTSLATILGSHVANNALLLLTLIIIAR